MATGNSYTRRQFLSRSGSLLAAAAMAGLPFESLAEQPLADLEVASAGSMRSMLDGPIRSAVAQTLKLDLHTHAQGADAVAAAIVGGSLQADVFIPITAGPMQTVLGAGKARVAYPIARTELVLVYSPKSRFAPRFEAAATGNANWWEVMQEPGLRIGRGNPAADPGARAILFAMMLAAKKYRQSDLVTKTLGPVLNPAQIVPNVQARLQSGELDVSASYRIATQWSRLPYLTLPPDINLSEPDVHATQPGLHLDIDGKTFYPEPLIFYAAFLNNSTHPQGAHAFMEWLKGPQAATLFQQHLYNAPGTAVTLQA